MRLYARAEGLADRFGPSARLVRTSALNQREEILADWSERRSAPPSALDIRLRSEPRSTSFRNTIEAVYAETGVEERDDGGAYRG